MGLCLHRVLGQSPTGLPHTHMFRDNFCWETTLRSQQGLPPGRWEGLLATETVKGSASGQGVKASGR